MAGAEELLAPFYPGAVPVDERLVELKAATALGGLAGERRLFLVKDEPGAVVEFHSSNDRFGARREAPAVTAVGNTEAVAREVQELMAAGRIDLNPSAWP